VHRLNPQDCVTLFDIALNRTGFTASHSYAMLNEDRSLLELAIEIMGSSGRYSPKQMDYARTLPIVKTIHEGLMRKGGLTSDFDDSDKKRYSNVVVYSTIDEPTLGLVPISYSENGLRTSGGDQLSDSEKLPPDYNMVMSRLEEGDHLIRYMNKPYFDKYQEETWVPVFLRRGRMVDPLN